MPCSLSYQTSCRAPYFVAGGYTSGAKFGHHSFSPGVEGRIGIYGTAGCFLAPSSAGWSRGQGPRSLTPLSRQLSGRWSAGGSVQGGNTLLPHGVQPHVDLLSFTVCNRKWISACGTPYSLTVYTSGAPWICPACSWLAQQPPSNVRGRSHVAGNVAQKRLWPPKRLTWLDTPKCSTLSCLWIRTFERGSALL